MTIDKKISMAMAHAGISQAELARRIGMSPQLLGQKLKTQGFKVTEMDRIAEACGGTWIGEIRFDDGTVL